MLLAALESIENARSAPMFCQYNAEMAFLAAFDRTFDSSATFSGSVRSAAP
jgi:hypothetical protein